MKKGCIEPIYKQRLTHRLKIIQGQVKGLEKAVEKENYCVDTISQSLAIQKSLKSFDVLMLENHLKVHVSGQSNNKGLSTNVKELVKIYRLNRR